MKEQQVEYLDFTKPKRKEQWEVPSVKEEMAQLVEKYKTVKVQIIAQIKELVKPSYKLSLLIELQNHKIEAKVGIYQSQNADAIILPYNSSELFYYPCNCFKEEDLKTDKEKIKDLNSQTNQLYLRSKKLLNYKFRAYVKCQQESASKDLIIGVNSLIKLIIEKKIPLLTIAIFFSSNLYGLPQLFQSLLHLEIDKQDQPFTFILVLPSRKELNSLYNCLE